MLNSPGTVTKSQCVEPNSVDWMLANTDIRGVYTGFQCYWSENRREVISVDEYYYVIRCTTGILIPPSQSISGKEMTSDVHHIKSHEKVHIWAHCQNSFGRLKLLSWFSASIRLNNYWFVILKKHIYYLLHRLPQTYITFKRQFIHCVVQFWINAITYTGVSQAPACSIRKSIGALWRF